MRPFMDEDFLLNTPTARTLYHTYGAGLPIIDYHCHVSPKEIFEDRHFETITQAWLAGDHYKWRLMRSNGVEERLITGNASDREKFQAFAETLPRAVGNPLYHWCHLELQTYFGYQGVLNGSTAQAVWDLCAQRLLDPDMGARGFITRSRVAFVGTTDDPTDTLEWHQKLAADPTMKTVVAPTFRPDKLLNVDKAGWREQLAALEQSVGAAIPDLAALKAALRLRMEHFDRCGCRASDHGLDYLFYRPGGQGEADAVLRQALSGAAVSQTQAEVLKTDLLLFCGAQYTQLNWVMQLHFNCIRNPNTTHFQTLGPDAGFDCINPASPIPAAALLDAFYRTGTLPRTVLYSLNPADNAFLACLIGSFQGPGVRGKLQHGSAWWFNDHQPGMEAQLTNLANLGVLGNFIGMLTDSRSFLSYTRHIYFRRILCNLLGDWVESGAYPHDMETLGGLVQDICSRNAVRYFNLEEPTL